MNFRIADERAVDAIREPRPGRHRPRLMEHLLRRGLGLLTVSALAVGCSATSPAAPSAEPSSRPPARNDSVEPKRFVSIPHIKPYVSVERAKRQLERAGLLGVSPDVRWPHYFVMTRPKGGTRVEVGSEVQLLIGDG
jgi:hypothetical protein